MAKSTNNAGNATAKRRSDRMSPASPGTGAANAKRATAKMKTAETSAAKATTATKSKPAARTTARRTTTRTAAKRATQKAARQEGASARLRPIEQRQSRSEIIATIVADSGVERPIVERVARSSARTYQRHLMRKGSGRVEILDLGAALWRGKEGAREAREMASPLLDGRIVTIPARKARAVPRLAVHETLREIVARA